MGAPHTVRALANMILPTGSLMNTGMHLLEDLSQSHGDSLGNLARLVNEIHEIFPPPPVVWDMAQSPFVFSSTSNSTFARYMFSTEGKGTGLLNSATGAEQLVLTPVAWVDNAGEELILEVESPFGNSRGSVTITNLNVGVEASSLTFTITDQGLLSQEIVLKARVGTVGDQGNLESWRIDWKNDDTTIPDGPHQNGFIPMAPARIGDENSPVSVETLRRMINGLRILAERRGSGHIISWSDPLGGGLLKKPGATDVILRAIARQPPRVKTLRLWLYGTDTNPVSGSKPLVQVAGVSHEITANFGTSGIVWRMIDIPVLPHRRSESIRSEFRIDLNGNDSLIFYAACAWWRPAFA